MKETGKSDHFVWEQATDVNPVMFQLMELAEKFFKSTVIFMFNEIKMYTPEMNGKVAFL